LGDRSLCSGTLPGRGSAPEPSPSVPIDVSTISIDLTAISIAIAASYDEEGVVLTAISIAIAICYGLSSTAFARTSRQLGHRSSPTQASFQGTCCGVHEVFDHLRCRFIDDISAT
jgi:hypothetical protein